MADGSPVAVFTDNGDDQKLSACDTPEVEIATVQTVSSHVFNTLYVYSCSSFHLYKLCVQLYTTHASCVFSLL